MTKQPPARHLAASTATALALACSIAFAGNPAAGNADGTAAAEERELLRSIVSQSRAAVKSEDIAVRLDGQPTLGDAGAVLTLIEFSDLQCGYCRRHLLSVLPVLRERYVSTGQVRYAFFDFPVDQRHPEARGAAVAVRCAADQNVFEPMRARLYAHPAELQQENLPRHAEALGLDGTRFSVCLADGSKAEAVNRDVALGEQLRVRGTPTFLLGYSNGQYVRVARRIVGAQPLEVFESAIQALLAEPQGSMAQAH